MWKLFLMSYVTALQILSPDTICKHKQFVCFIAASILDV